MNLDEIRVVIDELDKEITALLVKRMDVTNQVAEYKLKNNLPIYHPEREKAVIEKVSRLAGEQYAEHIAVIYQCMMDESKKNQEKFMAAKLEGTAR